MSPGLCEKSIPAGLEFLAVLDEVVVIEEPSSNMSVFSRWAKDNCSRYSLKNIAGQTVYYAVEQLTDDLLLNLLILNHLGHVVLQASTSTTNATFLCPLVRLDVVASKGQTLGSVQQSFRWCCSKRSVLEVVDSKEKTVMRIEGPQTDQTATVEDSAAHHFDLLSLDGQKIGYVARDFPGKTDISYFSLYKSFSQGFFHSLYTSSVIVGVKFPVDLHVHMKAVLLASSFLLAKLYYGRRGRAEERGSVNASHEIGIFN